MNHAESQQFQSFRRQGDFEGAVSLLQPTIHSTENTPQRWHALSVLALFALDEGYFDQALLYCSDLEAMDEKDAFVHDLKGILYRLKGELDQSERELKRSLDLIPSDTDPGNRFVTVTELGKTLLAADRLDECEELCTFDWNPDDNAHLNVISPGENMQMGDRMLLLARLSRKQRKFPESIDFFRRAIRLHRAMRTLTINGDALLKEFSYVIREAKQSQSNENSDRSKLRGI